MSSKTKYPEVTAQMAEYSFHLFTQNVSLYEQFLHCCVNWLRFNRVRGSPEQKIGWLEIEENYQSLITQFEGVALTHWPTYIPQDVRIFAEALRGAGDEMFKNQPYSAFRNLYEDLRVILSKMPFDFGTLPPQSILKELGISCDEQKKKK